MEFPVYQQFSCAGMVLPNSEWSKRRITTSAQNILAQILPRSADRGLHTIDDSIVPTMALWSVLNWERKVGRNALEESGADRFELIRDLDDLLDEKRDELQVAYDPQQNILVYVKTRLPITAASESSLETLICQAERESHGMNHDYVGSEHVVLASIALADTALLAVLQRHGLDYAKTKQAVVDILGAC